MLQTEEWSEVSTTLISHALEKEIMVIFRRFNTGSLMNLPPSGRGREVTINASIMLWSCNWKNKILL